MVACVLALTGAPPLRAQLSPFPETTPQAGDARDLRESLPPDLADLTINPRRSSADRIARLFNRDLREIEESQADLVAQIENLPRVTRDMQRVRLSLRGLEAAAEVGPDRHGEPGRSGRHRAFSRHRRGR
jgi:hypothetical protein